MGTDNRSHTSSIEWIALFTAHGPDSADVVRLARVCLAYEITILIQIKMIDTRTTRRISIYYLPARIIYQYTHSLIAETVEFHHGARDGLETRDITVRI